MDSDRRADERKPLVSSALGAAAEEAVDHAGAAGADMAAAIGRKLLQHRARRHQHPFAVDQRAPLPVVSEIGARRSAVAVDAASGAVAAGVACARLLQLLVPVMVLGMALATLALWPERSRKLLGHGRRCDDAESEGRNNRPTAKGH